MSSFDRIFDWIPEKDLEIRVQGRTSDGYSNIARVRIGTYVTFEFTITNHNETLDSPYTISLLNTDGNEIANITADQFYSGFGSFATPSLSRGQHEFVIELRQNGNVVSSHVSIITAEVTKPVVTMFKTNILSGESCIEAGHKIGVEWDIVNCNEASLFAFGQAHQVNPVGTAELEVNCSIGKHRLEIVAKSADVCQFPEEACVTQVIEVEVIPPQPTITVDVPTKTSYIGQRNKITWRSNHCEILTLAKDNELVSEELNGEFEFIPTSCETAHLAFYGRNANGDSIEKEITVEIIAPEVKLALRKDRSKAYRIGETASINIGIYAADYVHVYTDSPSHNLDKTYERLTGNLAYEFEVLENINIFVEAVGLDGRQYKDCLAIEVQPPPENDPLNAFLRG